MTDLPIPLTGFIYVASRLIALTINRGSLPFDRQSNRDDNSPHNWVDDDDDDSVDDDDTVDDADADDDGRGGLPFSVLVYNLPVTNCSLIYWLIYLPEYYFLGLPVGAEGVGRRWSDGTDATTEMVTSRHAPAAAGWRPK